MIESQYCKMLVGISKWAEDQSPHLVDHHKMKKKTALIMYSTTKSPSVFVGPRPNSPLKVMIETAMEMKNMAAEAPRSNHTDFFVPSSYI